MRIRNLKNAKEILESSSSFIRNPEEYKGNFSKLFKNDNPIYLEIGMGKGDFLIKNAEANSNINYIGVDRYDTILAKAIQKIGEINLPNLKILRIDALELNDIFDKEIDLIFLNFSDPWPKKRHKDRRLTSPIFLNIYDGIFKSEKIIIQKTDNIDLFASSILDLSSYGYVIEDISFDLANTDIPNFTTEYEEKFMAKGIKINYLKAKKK